MKKILVIGSLNMDIVLTVSRMPVSGETVTGNGLRYSPGGKGANQACAIGRLGGNVTMLGCVGDDGFGRTLSTSLSQSGVNVEHIRHTALHPTGTAVIHVDSRGDNSIVVIPGANHACTTDFIMRHDGVLRDSDYIMLQMEIPRDAVWYAVKRGRELGKTVLLNPAPAPEEIPADIIGALDFITPNETELASLTGLPCGSEGEIRMAAETLLQRGAGAVLVTLGGRGSMLVNGSGTMRFPSIPVKPVDTTAAGDCFNGAFVTALSEGMPPEHAIPFAAVAAGIAVTGQGAQDSLPFRAEVDDYNRLT